MAKREIDNPPITPYIRELQAAHREAKRLLGNPIIATYIRELQTARRQLRNGPMTVRMTGSLRVLFGSCKKRTGSGTRCGNPGRIQWKGRSRS